MKTKLFEANVLCEMSSWGVGFQIATTKYSNWRFSASLDFLCFFFVIWFGKKTKRNTG